MRNLKLIAATLTLTMVAATPAWAEQVTDGQCRARWSSQVDRWNDIIEEATWLRAHRNDAGADIQMKRWHADNNLADYESRLTALKRDCGSRGYPGSAAFKKLP
jgi:hypothetical protein